MGSLTYDVIIKHSNISGKLAALVLAKHGFKPAFLTPIASKNIAKSAYVALNLHHLKTLRDLGIELNITYFRQIEAFFDKSYISFESNDIHYPAFSGVVSVSELEIQLDQKIKSIPVLEDDKWQSSGHYLLRTKLDDPTQTPVTYLSHHLSTSIVTINSWPTQCARQYFKNNAIFGFLPINQPGKFALVHSSKSPQLNLNHLKDMGINAIDIEHQQPYFQASTYHVDQYVNHRQISIHNACHMIHPLAGFGLNMGLSDLTALISHLRDNRLQIFAQERYLQNQKTFAAIWGLYHLYCDPGWQNSITDKGIYLTNACPILKSFFINQAMTI
jgi:2-polyprenyl-6-methoxyphenol hydroxylase-like FAD-dependent oxidoreductase